MHQDGHAGGGNETTQPSRTDEHRPVLDLYVPAGSCDICLLDCRSLGSIHPARRLDLRLVQDSLSRSLVLDSLSALDHHFGRLGAGKCITDRTDGVLGAPQASTGVAAVELDYYASIRNPGCRARAGFDQALWTGTAPISPNATHASASLCNFHPAFHVSARLKFTGGDRHPPVDGSLAKSGSFLGADDR